MAKKSKGNLAVPCSDVYKPRLYLDLQDKQVSQVKELKVGETVELRVTGKVVRLEQSERVDEDNKKQKTGSIALEGYSVDVMGDEPNEFTKLAEDD